MDIRRINTYADPRFPREVLYQRGICHIRDMALYSPEEQQKNWHDWCDAYFAAKSKTEEE